VQMCARCTCPCHNRVRRRCNSTGGLATSRQRPAALQSRTPSLGSNGTLRPPPAARCPEVMARWRRQADVQARELRTER